MKCTFCNKKIIFDTLSEYCKCGKLSCLDCRYPNHECDYNYHEQARKRIKHENPKIEPTKLVKI